MTPDRRAASADRALPAARLRVPTHEDAFARHRVFADPDVMEFHGGEAAELPVQGELTARQRRHDAERGFRLWTMVDETDRVIGFTGAQPWEQDWDPTGEIESGRRLGREHWGRGYATAAARQTLERVRTTGVPDVVAMVDARNTRSTAVTQRLGMRLTETSTTRVSRREGHATG
ncbi:GNAT family N-acetyltransferase [Streptomyces sp. GD-15H]|uniref:GNAT family N-acetyltransferase n=1 Tax=Streptomyces sp. GD-15H TaxID=3129112 RepID=UPI00324A9A8D